MDLWHREKTDSQLLIHTVTRELDSPPSPKVNSYSMSGPPAYSCMLVYSACPRWAQCFCWAGVMGLGVSPAGTELHRIVSSNPGAEKMNVRLIGSVPTFFRLIQVFAGINTSPPAWRSRS